MRVPPDPRRWNDAVIRTMREAMASVPMLATVPGLMRQVVHDELWRERMMQTGEVVTFDRFEDFMSAEPIEGCGTTLRALIEDVERIATELRAIEAGMSEGGK